MQILSVLKQGFTGSLLFNGLPLQNLHLRSLREHIGDLSSREDVFKGSIRENITLGNEAIKLPQLLKVIDEVGLSDFIREMPGGIDTEILPGGRNISRSTVSKMLIARSIVSKPQLLVVEEWLGNLNYRDRLRIAQLLTDRSQPWSLICVTEDPVIASMSDRVVVLKDGAIVFDGNFDALQKTPHYEKVFRTSGDTTL